MKDRLHHKNKAAWAQGQGTEVDDDASMISDDSLTLTAVSSAHCPRRVVRNGCRQCQLLSYVS